MGKKNQNVLILQIISLNVSQINGLRFSRKARKPLARGTMFNKPAKQTANFFKLPKIKQPHPKTDSFNDTKLPICEMKRTFLNDFFPKYANNANLS
jgi:hypothetical protein